MTLTDLLQRPELRITPLTGPFPAPVTGGYASDLLSDVLAGAHPGDVWVTVQTHRNVAAVAGLQGLAAVLIASGRQPHDDLLSLAREERITILSTPLRAFEITGMLYALGIR